MTDFEKTITYFDKHEIEYKIYDGNIYIVTRAGLVQVCDNDIKYFGWQYDCSKSKLN